MIKYLPNGQVPEFAASMSVPIIKICLTYFEKEILTFDQTLMAIILSLAEANERLLEQNIEMSYRQRDHENPSIG